jgi:hypothetical protein
MSRLSTSFSAVLVAVATGLLTGCVVSKPMPQSWEVAVVMPALPNDIAGTYANDHRPRLDEFFWDHAVEPMPETIELRWVGPSRLEVTAARRHEPPVVKVVDVTVETRTGGVRPPVTSHVDAMKGGVQLHRRGIELFRGKDGRLYGHVSEGGVAAFAWVIPVVGEGKSWRRWTPVGASPRAMAP